MPLIATVPLTALIVGSHAELLRKWPKYRTPARVTVVTYTSNMSQNFSRTEVLEVLHIDLFRERKLNTNFFFSQTFRAPPGYPGKIWRDIPPKKFDFPGFEEHIELFGPHPFMWKTPTPPEKIRTKKFRFGFLFRA